MNLKLLLVSLVFAMLIGCGGGQDGGKGKSSFSSATPDGAIMANIEAVRKNDLKQILQTQFSDEEYQSMKADWEKQRQEEISAEDKAEFENTIRPLIEDGAEEKLMALAEPYLEQAKQLPAMVLFGQMAATQAIQENEEMSGEEKEAAQKMLESAAKWVNATDFSSPDLARQAIDVATKTARGLDIESLEDVQDLEFDELLDKGGDVFGGVKQVLSVYGISLDDTLDSFKAETVSEEDDQATVNLSFNFLGADHSLPVEMVKSGGRWISKDAAKAMEEIDLNL